MAKKSPRSPHQPTVNVPMIAMPVSLLKEVIATLTDDEDEINETVDLALDRANEIQKQKDAARPDMQHVVRTLNQGSRDVDPSLVKEL